MADRDKVLRCPFCETMPSPPAEMDTPFGSTVECGKCGCGAVYVYDRTGRMQGEAFTDALAFVFEWDYDVAFAASEDSYEEAVIRFNPRLGKFFAGSGNHMERGGRFYFLRLKKSGSQG